MLGLQSQPRRVLLDRPGAHGVQQSGLHQGGGRAAAGLAREAGEAIAVGGAGGAGMGTGSDCERAAARGAAAAQKEEGGVKNSYQLSAVTGARRCAVEGCGSLLMGRGEYCGRREEEIEALAEIAARKDWRREQKRQVKRLRGSALHRLRGRLAALVRATISRAWMLGLVLLGAAAFYLGWTGWTALLDWLNAGGWAQ